MESNKLSSHLLCFIMCCFSAGPVLASKMMRLKLLLASSFPISRDGTCGGTSMLGTNAVCIRGVSQAKILDSFRVI